MKKHIVPALLFAAVFITGLLCQKYTLQFQESDGLFLFAPDYFRSVFSHPFPLSRIVTDFLTQFYRLSLVAPLILSLEAVLVFYLTKGILSRLGLGFDFAAALVAASVWCVAAHGASTIVLTASLLCLLPVWCLSLFFKRKDSSAPKADGILSSAVIAAALLVVALSPKVRYTEKWAMVKNALLYQKNASLCEKITPARVEKDHELMPFVALAMGEEGLLGEKLFTYPVYGENDLDMCDEEDYYNSLLFRFFLYRNMGCPNEAIHNLFQLTVLQWHGTSFMALRQLVQEYYKAGDYDMVEKYCKVLDRSVLHRRFTRFFRGLVSEGHPAEDTDAETRSKLPLISKNPLQNLLLLQSRGMLPDKGLDRILTTLLLQRKVDLFAQLLQNNRERYERIPQHYQEAIAVYLHENELPVFMYPILPDPPVLGRFRRFASSLAIDGNREEQQKDFGENYCFYYYYME